MDYRDYPEYSDAMENRFAFSHDRKERRRELLHFYELDHNSRGEPDLYGYKVLFDAGRWWASPSRFAIWNDHRLVSDYVPTEQNSSGIYVAKRIEDAMDYIHFHYPRSKMFIVGMKPTIIEHELGYRAHKAYLIQEVVI